jgi:hypothetical protein
VINASQIEWTSLSRLMGEQRGRMGLANRANRPVSIPFINVPGTKVI